MIRRFLALAAIAMVGGFATSSSSTPARINPPVASQNEFAEASPGRRHFAWPARPLGLERIDQRAVWAGDISRCQTPTVQDLNSCLVEVMRTSGASPQAMAFVRHYGSADFLSGAAYLSKFTSYGPVDLAVTACPFRANSNDNFILVNGEPGIVDAAKEPDEQSLERFPLYRRLKSAHPNLMSWPLDETFIDQERPGGRGQRFLFSVPLQECHACEIVAVATLAYDFDATGHYLGIKVLNLTRGVGR